MDARYSEDGDPYSPAERRRPLVRPWVWAAVALAVIGVMAYAWVPKHIGAVPAIEEAAALVIPQPTWNGYQALPKPEVRQAALEPDPRVDALQRQLQAMQEEDMKQRELLRQLQQRPAPPTPAAAAAPTPAAPKPVKRAYRDMGHLAFVQAEEKTEAEPLYILAPADTKIACTVETKQNSDVESVGTIKVNVNVFDTDSRRRLLIPQGSTILVKYTSNNLVYGNQRLPEHSTILTLPNGTTKELNDEPVMDQVGQAGLVSSVDNHYFTGNPCHINPRSIKRISADRSSINPIVGGVAGSTAQYGQRITQPYIDTRPTILVEAGEECLVILTRTIKLPEYREKRS